MDGTPATSRPKRILFVLEYYYPHIGGCETLFQQLAEALAAQGHFVSVVTLRLEGTPGKEWHHGVEIIRVSVPRRGARFFFTIFSIPAVLRRARAADLIHSTTYNAAFPAWLASLVSRKPAVITVHEVFAEQWNNLPGLNRWLGYGFRMFEWAVLHLSFAHYLCDSRFTQDRLVRSMGVDPLETSVVYPAIDYAFWSPSRHRPRDLKRELQLEPDTFLYLFFGRPGVSKGVEYLIEAVPLVQARLPQSRLILIMPRDPPGQYDRIVGRIKALGIEKSVTVLAPVARSELPGYLLAADCVVIPSLSEGFGYAASEAALLGCPVVATAGHAVEEVLGKAIRLVPPRQPQALADAITAIARDRPTSAVIPRHHDVETHIAGVCRVYENLARRKKTSRPRGSAT